MLVILGVLACFALCVVVFVGFVAVRSVQWLVRVGSGRVSPAMAEPIVESHSRCRNPGCRTANPPHARFCRRCGTAVGTANRQLRGASLDAPVRLAERDEARVAQAV